MEINTKKGKTCMTDIWKTMLGTIDKRDYDQSIISSITKFMLGLLVKLDADITGVDIRS